MDVTIWITVTPTTTAVSSTTEGMPGLREVKESVQVNGVVHHRVGFVYPVFIPAVAFSLPS